ncbi:SPOR domain-containing protein [Chitinimonas taiwanensis]|uniref:Sporulation related domain-containing protein n=1 Tax=Chitinimonas taiwanensis DSM 18899 TaxID=1121279 RepID=A0A1K2H7N7_9NEIS|nr:SPOR domain-containing protein [Chitinimonas taiwanensis]SFZ72640.1 Sporulation related domain-containing protein [Chitinimonas taiwanensis DSM 18899]
MSAIRPSPNRVQPPPSPEEDAEQKEIRQRLMQRLAIAVCLIVVAALAITFLNRFEQKPTVSAEGPAINPLQAETSSEPAPAVSAPPAANTETAPIISIGPDPETGSAGPEAATTQPNAEESVASTPPANSTNATVSKPSGAQVELAPFDPDGGSTDIPPATIKQDKPAAPAKTNPTTSSNKPNPPASSPARTEVASTPSASPSNSQPVIAPPPRAARAPATTPEQTIVALATGVQPAGTRGFTVQAGVFQSGSNAEKLISRLSSAGIPARLETRVQIGPFKSREEADLMMRRLREMGVTPILQAPAPQ